MLSLVVLFIFLFPCQHGPLCDQRTITWDPSVLPDGSHDTSVLEYRLYWGSNTLGPIDEDGFPFAAQMTIDTCPATCSVPAPACRESCVVYIRHPSPGNIIFFSLVAVNSAGEGGQ